MKSFLLLASLALFAFSGTAFAQQGQTIEQNSTAKWDHKVHNFGSIEYDSDGNCIFAFKNEGDKPLIISKVNTSCGCTTPSYSKEPIQPGQSGEVKAHYDTKRVGSFHKTLTVVFTDGTQTSLTIKGVVGPKPAATSN